MLVFILEDDAIHDPNVLWPFFPEHLQPELKGATSLQNVGPAQTIPVRHFPLELSKSIIQLALNRKFGQGAITYNKRTSWRFPGTIEQNPIRVKDPFCRQGVYLFDTTLKTVPRWYDELVDERKILCPLSTLNSNLQSLERHNTCSNHQ